MVWSHSSAAGAEPFPVVVEVVAEEPGEVVEVVDVVGVEVELVEAVVDTVASGALVVVDVVSGAVEAIVSTGAETVSPT